MSGPFKTDAEIRHDEQVISLHREMQIAIDPWHQELVKLFHTHALPSVVMSSDGLFQINESDDLVERLDEKARPLARTLLEMIGMIRERYLAKIKAVP